MATYVGLLRAVNVGGFGKLAMTDLARLCEEAGCDEVRTYIASGNAVFRYRGSEDEVRTALEDQPRRHTGRTVGVMVRSDAEIGGVLARNPFRDAPGNRVMALFTDDPLPADPLSGARGLAGEEVRLGSRELFIHYPEGMAASRLKLPAAATGTARNLNTVGGLARICAARGEPSQG